MEEGSGLSFWDHLEVLRWTLFRVLIALFVLMIGAFVLMPHIFDAFVLGPTSSDFFIYKLLASAGKLPLLPDFGDDSFKVDIININVASQFMTHLSCSFWFALVLVFPYLLYQVWAFIRPALYPNELSSVSLAFSMGTLMFYLGCALGYCVVFPFTFRFLSEYQLGEGIVNQINLNSYMSIFLMMVFIMGVVFELPLLAWLLSKLGVLRKANLVAVRKYALVAMMILSAVITPTGDPFTMMLVFVPLWLLYELSIVVIK